MLLQNFRSVQLFFLQVELFKELVTGFRTPIPTPPPLSVPAQTLSEDNKLKGYIHVDLAESADFPEEVRSRARLAMMKMLQLADDFEV